MKNKIRILGIIALVAVIGFSFIACPDGNNNDDTTHTHAWGAWTVTTDPKCTTAGEETRVCSLDATHVEKQPISALGHDWGEWVVTTESTYFAEGVETETCNHDDSHTNGTRPIPSVPFTDIATFATELAKQPANTAAAPYSVRLNVSDLGTSPNSVGKALSDNTTKYVSLDLSGSTLTSIGYQAFGSCATLTSVIIPNSVTSVSNQAFYESGLTSVTIPGSVTSIENWAFAGCTGLTRVTFAAGSNILLANFGMDAFATELLSGDRPDRNSLRDAYLAVGGGAGTYTRDKGSDRIDLWTKQ